MRRRYSWFDHVLTRLVSVFVVAAAVGPWLQETRSSELTRWAALPHGQLLEALRAEAIGDPIAETIGTTFLAGVLLLAAVEGFAQLIRIFVIPRGD